MTAISFDPKVSHYHPQENKSPLKIIFIVLAVLAILTLFLTKRRHSKIEKALPEPEIPSEEVAREVDFELRTAKVTYTSDLETRKVMRMLLGPEENRDPFQALLAKNLLGALDVIPIKYPKIAVPKNMALNRLAENYRIKHGIELHVVKIEHLDSFLKDKKGFFGVIVTDWSQHSLHVSSLLCHFTDDGLKEFLTFDPTSNEQPIFSIYSVIGSLGRVFCSSESKTQVDYFSCRTASLLFLRNALLDLKANPRSFTQMASKDENINLPASWVASEQIFHKKEGLNSKQRQFRERYDEEVSFKCVLKHFGNVGRFYEQLIASKPPQNVVLNEKEQTVSFNVSMKINTYVVKKGFQFLSRLRDK